MRHVIFIISLLSSPSIFAAEVREEINTLNSVSLEEEELSFIYTVGGGYQVHTAEASIEITSDREINGIHFLNVKLQVTDTAPKEDTARGLVQVKGNSGLRALVRTALEKKGLKGMFAIEQVELLPIQNRRDFIILD